MLLTMRLLLRVLLAIVLTAAATAEEDDFSRPLQPAVSLRRASGTLAPSVRETFENLSPAALRRCGYFVRHIAARFRLGPLLSWTDDFRQAAQSHRDTEPQPGTAASQSLNPRNTRTHRVASLLAHSVGPHFDRGSCEKSSLSRGSYFYVN